LFFFPLPLGGVCAVLSYWYLLPKGLHPFTDSREGGNKEIKEILCMDIIIFAQAITTVFLELVIKVNAGCFLKRSKLS
jgi:hypothetical protein